MTLVQRLRSLAKFQTATNEMQPEDHIAWLAADRIEQLEAENAALREDAERMDWLIEKRLLPHAFTAHSMTRWNTKQEVLSRIDAARSQP